MPLRWYTALHTQNIHLSVNERTFGVYSNKQSFITFTDIEHPAVLTFLSVQKYKELFGFRIYKGRDAFHITTKIVLTFTARVVLQH